MTEKSERTKGSMKSRETEEERQREMVRVRGREWGGVEREREGGGEEREREGGVGGREGRRENQRSKGQRRDGK